jgi:SAM-dependent methyltransferase
MDKSYVQQYGQLENNHWWFIIRRKIILQTLRNHIPDGKLNKLSILNVGAAAGGSSKWLMELGKVVSLENDPLFLSYLSTQNLSVIDASATDIPFNNNHFDLVCAFDVIEHVTDDQKALAELVRVCKPGGHICITVPAFQVLWGTHDKINGHKRRYIQRQLKDLTGFTDTTILYSSYFNALLFFPVFLFRKIQLIFGNKDQQNEADFAYFKSNTIVNSILKKVFGVELFLLKLFRFPVGVSLIMIIRKNNISVNRPK